MTHRRLLDPDPPGKGGGTTPPSPPPADPPKPPTSADTGAGGKTAREVELEKRVATLEDSNKTLGDQLKGVLTSLEAKDKNPKPGNLMDEVNEVLGFGLA
jgi:hypothetical protein